CRPRRRSRERGVFTFRARSHKPGAPATGRSRRWRSGLVTANGKSKNENEETPMSVELQERIRPVRAAAPAAPAKPGAPDRLISLDAYRGFVMLAMVSAGLGMAHLRNDPTWGWLADQMGHRDWEGCTFWDLIQPSFMFIVGASMPFAFA